MPAMSLVEMELDGYAQTDGRRLQVRIPADWPAEGEKRIGYVSILRLAEAVRELHWRLDIAGGADTGSLDSITKSVTADFVSPVMADTDITCSYALTWVRRRSYGLRVTLADGEGDQLARIDLTSVFIDPGTLRPVETEPSVTAQLRTQVIGDTTTTWSVGPVSGRWTSSAGRRRLLPAARAGTRRIGSGGPA